jgi:hypothetical protein
VPYVICGACRLVTYSAALWSGTDECPRCGSPLPFARRERLLACELHAELETVLREDEAGRRG